MTHVPSSSLRALHGSLERHFRIYAAMTVVVLVAAGFLLVLQPTMTDLRSVGIFQLRQTKERLAKKQELLDLTQRLVEKYRGINFADTNKLQLLLPEYPDIASMFVQMEALAQSAGMQLTNISFSDSGSAQQAKKTADTNTETKTKTNTPGETKPGAAGNTASAQTSPLAAAGIERLSVSFSVTGGSGYTSFKQLLDTVESNIRLLDIASISYSPAQKELAETYLINAVTYYRK